MSVISPLGDRRLPVPDVSTEHVAGGGLRIWVAILAPVGLWTVHFMACVSLVRLACLDSRWTWVMHGTTVATAVPTVACIGLSWGILARGRRADAGHPATQTRFLGRLGLLVGLINLVLILLEGTLVAVVDACAR
jgi:hypothetical protein